MAALPLGHSSLVTPLSQGRGGGTTQHGHLSPGDVGATVVEENVNSCRLWCHKSEPLDCLNGVVDGVECPGSPLHALQR